VLGDLAMGDRYKPRRGNLKKQFGEGELNRTPIKRTRPIFKKPRDDSRSMRKATKIERGSGKTAGGKGVLISEGRQTKKFSVGRKGQKLEIEEPAKEKNQLL